MDRWFSRGVIDRLRPIAVTFAGRFSIAGEKMRYGSPDAQEVLSRQGHYQSMRDNLRVKRR